MRRMLRRVVVRVVGILFLKLGFWGGGLDENLDLGYRETR